MEAAYVGAKSGECRRLLLTDADATMLERLWQEAATQICGAVPGLSITDGADGASPLAAHLRRFMASHMLAGWLRLCSVEADFSAAIAEQGLLQRSLAPKTRRMSAI